MIITGPMLVFTFTAVEAGTLLVSINSWAVDGAAV
jgi:hypothetical protein